MPSNMRRYVGALIILIIAAGFSWWSAKAESRVTIHVQEEVIKLLPLYQNNPKSIDSFVVDSILRSTLINSLEEVRLKSSEHGGNLSVVVTVGDDKEFGDGTATHVAVFQINNEPIAGLRIICSSDSDPLLISGAWIK